MPPPSESTCTQALSQDILHMGKLKRISQGSELLLNQRFTALTRFLITFYMVLPSYLFIYLSINKSFRNKFALVGFRPHNLSPR